MKPNGTTCVSVYMYEKDIALFNQLRAKVNLIAEQEGEPRLKKNETWRFILQTAALLYGIGGDNAKIVDTEVDKTVETVV